MIRRPPRSTLSSSSAASDVYKRQELDRIPFRDSSMAMDQAIPLLTGDKDVEFRGGYDNNDRIYVRQSQALPLTVLALYPRMNTFDT